MNRTIGALACRFAGLVVVAAIGCGGDAIQPEKSDSTGESPRHIRVAVAANLKFAFQEIEAAFRQASPEIRLEVAYGSSGNFYAQLTQRAPFDIFFSADTEYPRRLVELGLADEDAYFPYATGEIVVWLPQGSRLDLKSQGIQVLVDPSVLKVANANPRLAPYGVAAEEAMKHFDVYDRVQPKFVLGENLAQVAQFLESGAADAGILSASLALMPQLQQQGRYWSVPTDAYSPIRQAAVIPNWCRDRPAVEQLRDLMTKGIGRDILKKYGYQLPDETTVARTSETAGTSATIQNE